MVYTFIMYTLKIYFRTLLSFYPVFSQHLFYVAERFCNPPIRCGPEEDRTPDPLLAKQVLSHLSYRPENSEPIKCYLYL